MRSMSSEAAAKAKRGSMLTTKGSLPRNSIRSAGGSPAGPSAARWHVGDNAGEPPALRHGKLRKIDFGDIRKTEVLVLPGRFFAADEIDFITRATVFEVNLQFGSGLHLHISRHDAP